MFIEPTITWVPSGFSGYIWFDTKIVLKKKKKLYILWLLYTLWSLFNDFTLWLLTWNAFHRISK